MLDEFIKYTYLADQMMIKALAETNFSIEKANRLFSHVLTSQHIWAKRILLQTPTLGVWEMLEPTGFAGHSEENFKMLNEITANIPLDKVIDYSNSSGQSFGNKVNDILLHVCNHCTYHRAQIASMLKENQVQPPATDYIFFKRQNLL
ncbi:DinB family protein [Pedobacter sp.]|uniref:DinB family protein n=1 Tax=Pedobacter sp. TaxID=1411316 RepID=UPI00396C9799